MKSFLLALLFILVFGKAMAQEVRHLDADELFAKKDSQPQQTEEVQQSANSLIITPVDDCFAKLSKEDVDDVKRNYEKPYQECLRRVRVSEDKKNSITMTTPSTETKDKKIEETSKKSPQDNFNK